MPSLRPRTKSNKAMNKPTKTLPSDPAQKALYHCNLVAFDDAVLDLFDLTPTVAEEIETLFCPPDAGFGDIEDCYYSWSPDLFTKKNVAAGQAILEDHLNGVDGFRRLLHNDIPRERYWNGRWRPKWNKEQICYDEFLERRIKVWRRTRVLIERLEKLGEAVGGGS